MILQGEFYAGVFDPALHVSVTRNFSGSLFRDPFKVLTIWDGGRDDLALPDILHL